MLTVQNQLLGLVVLVLPIVAIRWNLAGRRSRRRPAILASTNTDPIWRLEVYSVDDEAVASLTDPANVPFPVKRVRSARSARAAFEPELAWTLPRAELEVEVAEPFATDCLSGLLGVDHRVRFVTDNEAVIEASSTRLRIRAFQMG